MIAGSRRVQSARTSATPRSANASRTTASFSTSRLLTWQVTHQAAVKSTNTGLPAASSSRDARRRVRPARDRRRRDAPWRCGDAALARRAPRPRTAATRPTTAPTQPATAQRRRTRVDRRRGTCATPTARTRRTTSVTSRRTTASLSTCAPSTQASHATVAYSGNASNCLKRSIHAPGLGQHAPPRRGTTRAAGTAAPCRRRARRTRAASSAAGCASAKPSAAPMNGAVHGDATTTASTPDSAAFDVRVVRGPARRGRRHERRELEHARQVEREHEEEHARGRDHRRRLQLEAPAELLARRAQREEHRRERDERHDDARAEREALAGAASSGCRGRARRAHSALSDSTGNTHGIRFSTTPPTNANSDRGDERQRASAGGRGGATLQRGRRRARGLRSRDHGAGERDVDRRSPGTCASPLAKPSSPSSTPATCVNPGASWFGDRQRQRERAVGLARERLLAPTARCGRPRTGRSGASAGVGRAGRRRSASATTFWPSPRAAASQPGQRRAATRRASRRSPCPTADRDRRARPPAARASSRRLLGNAGLAADQPLGLRRRA